MLAAIVYDFGKWTTEIELQIDQKNKDLQQMN
jgi:hypothetical protein